jgi:type IV secretion system protein VirB8
MKHETLDDYFRKARTFEQDRLIMAEKSRRTAWMVAAGACAMAVVAVLAVAMLAPFKTVEPFVIRVDNSTGIVDVVTALSDSKDTYDEAVTKYFASKYVRAREGFVSEEAPENFRTVSLLSEATEQQRFAAYYRGSNPESPQVVYGRSATARITVKSISVINRNVAQVRYLREVRRGEESKITHWIATMTFSYVKTPMSEGNRLTNPLGFLVSEYKADPEAVQ